MHEKRGAH